MIPGVGNERRRRIHHHIDTFPARCLPYHYQSDLNGSSASQEINSSSKVVAARNRLEERLTTISSKKDRYTGTQNYHSDHGPESASEVVDDSYLVTGDSDSFLRFEKYTQKPNGKMLFFKRKSKIAQEDCAVCLEQFKLNQTLAHLSCRHKFHSSCLIPWLEQNPVCPYCRTRLIL